MPLWRSSYLQPFQSVGQGSGWHEEGAQQESVSATVFAMTLIPWISPAQTHLYHALPFSGHGTSRAWDHSHNFVLALEADNVTTSLSAPHSAFICSYMRNIPQQKQIHGLRRNLEANNDITVYIYIYKLTVIFLLPKLKQ